MERFRAIVLAGGASARMGRPKALLPFGGEQEIPGLDPAGTGFLDVDTPDAYRRALEMISADASR